MSEDWFDVLWQEEVGGVQWRVCSFPWESGQGVTVFLKRGMTHADERVIPEGEIQWESCFRSGQTWYPLQPGLGSSYDNQIMVRAGRRFERDVKQAIEMLKAAPYRWAANQERKAALRQATVAVA